MLSPLTIAIDELAPILLAPASITDIASFSHLTPPEALTPMLGPTVSLINFISAGVDPPVPNPVEVFTKSVPALTANSQAFTFSSSVK